MSPTSHKGLNVRHDERRAVELPAEFVISDGHGAQVHFSSASGAIGAHVIACMVVDVSTGGVGLHARHFVPRLAEGVIRVFLRRSNGAADRQPVFEHAVKVRRVELVGREPRYLLGLAFTERGPEVERSVQRLLERLDSEEGKDGQHA